MTAGLPAAAILIATRDRSDKIPALLRSIAAGDGVDFEAVIIDQSTDGQTKEAVAEEVGDDPRFRYVASSETGLSRARNLAASLTTAPLLVIADDDCVVPADWLPELLRPFRDQQVGLVFCTVVPIPFDVPGHTPHITFDHDTVLTTPPQAWRAAAGGLPLGAGMAIRRTAYDDAGGFDDHLGAGAEFGSTEDSDLSWRMMLRGWATVHASSPTVVHDGFRDLDQFKLLVRRDLHGVGGALTKYLRRGPLRIRLGALAFLAGWLVRLGVIGPARDVLARRRPVGLRRPVLLLGGVRDGFRTRLGDADHLLFEPSPHLTRSSAAP